MTAERSYRVLSYRFSVWANSPLLEAPAAALLGLFDDPHPIDTPERASYGLVDVGPHDPERFRVFLGDRMLARAAEPAPVIDALVRHVDAAATARTGDFLLVRGAALVTSRGGGVVVVGATTAEASAVVAGLVARGAGWLSGRSVVLDPVTRRLHAYPMPLRFRVGETGYGGGAVLPTLVTGEIAHVRADEVSGTPPAAPCPVAHVVVLASEPDASRSEPISPAQALVGVGAHALNLRLYGERGLLLLEDVVRGATRHRVTWSHTDRLVDLVSDVVAPGRDGPAP